MKIRDSVVGLIATRDFEVKHVVLQMAKYWKILPVEAVEFSLLYLEQARQKCIRPDSALGLKVKRDLFKISSKMFYRLSVRILFYLAFLDPRKLPAWMHDKFTLLPR